MGVNQWKCTLNLMCTYKYKNDNQFKCMLKFVCTEKFKYVIPEGEKDMYRYMKYSYIYIYMYMHI